MGVGEGIGDDEGVGVPVSLLPQADNNVTNARPVQHFSIILLNSTGFMCDLRLVYGVETPLGIKKECNEAFISIVFL